MSSCDGWLALPRRHDTCMHTHMHMHMHLHAHACTCMHTHTHTHTCIRTCMHAHTHAYTHTRIGTLLLGGVTRAHAYTHMHMHMHTCIHTHDSLARRRGTCCSLPLYSLFAMSPAAATATRLSIRAALPSTRMHVHTHTHTHMHTCMHVHTHLLPLDCLFEQRWARLSTRQDAPDPRDMKARALRAGPDEITRGEIRAR